MGGDSLLILGLGNLLCGDDGLGVVAVEELRRRYRPAPPVRILDGGTLGLTLLSHIRAADDLILVDAIGAEAPAGTLVRLHGEEVPPAVRNRLSVHQIGVADLLDALYLLDAFPRKLVLLGLVPATLELGLARTPAVDAALPRLVEAVAAEARAMGYELPEAADDAFEQAADRPAALRALGL